MKTKINLKNIESIFGKDSWQHSENIERRFKK